MVHVAYIQLMNVDGLGNVVKRNDATINQMKNTQMEQRIMVDPLIPSSATNPTVKDYIIAEEVAGFRVTHIDQTMIISYDS